MAKKYRLDKGAAELWLAACHGKQQVPTPRSPHWTVFHQPGLFVHSEVGIVFVSDGEQWIVRASELVGKQLVRSLGNQTVEEVLKAIT